MASGQLGLVLHQLRRMLGGPAADATDRQLLEQYAATGDEPAFTQLVRRHGPMVQGVCQRVLGRDPEADDAFQATFLVLAQKADSAFWQESIGNWLYGVAYRTASKVRARSARRRQVERDAAGQRGAVGTETGDAHELQQVLDEELIRLPEKFRMPVLLCCLQDQTIDEAAQQLGWSCTTVKGRLQRGREMLRNRLQRRGIGLSAGVLAAILTQGVVNAIPPALLKTTVQTVVAGTLSESVTALAQGVMQAMFWTKLKTASLVLLALAVLGSGAGTVFYRGSTTSAAPLPEEVKKQPSAKPTSTLTQDGLEVVVTMTKAAFAADETPTLEITYTNRTEKAFRLHDVGFEISHYSILELGTNGPWQAGPWVYFTRPLPKSVELAAGNSFVQTHKPHGSFAWKGEQSAPVQSRNVLAPGKYRLTGAIVFNGERDNNAVPFWNGALTTNPVEFEIKAEKAAAPLSVKDANSGLTVTVTDDAKVLTATDAAGKVVWKLNLIASVKDFLGTPAIGSVSINAQGQVEARFGKSNLARIDLKTGKLLEHLAR